MTQASAPEKHVFFISLRTKLIVALAVLFSIAFAVIFLWLYSFVTDLAMKNLQTDLIATAETAASGIDGDAHAKLYENGQIDDATYTQIADFLRSVKKTNPQASGMYTYVLDPATPGQVLLVVSAALPPGAEAVDISQRLGECLVQPASRPDLRQEYADTSPAMLDGVKVAGADTKLWTDEWGSWLSGYAPIYDSAGQPVAAVGVDMCAADVVALQQSIQRNTMIAMGVALLVLIVVVGLVAASVTKPVMELTRVADRIGMGEYDQDFSHLYSTRVQDEVDKLANVFELMVDKVYTREQTLRARVQQLEIMIDQSKLETQVAEIVDSDFFQDLQSKVQGMRSRFKGESD